MIEEKKEIDEKSDLSSSEPPAKKRKTDNIPTQELGVFGQVAALVRGQLVNQDGQKNYFGQKSVEEAFSLILGDRVTSKIESLVDRNSQKARPFSEVHKELYGINDNESKIASGVEKKARNISSGSISPESIVSSKSAISKFS